MKAAFTSKQATVEKCLNNVGQPLPIILFTLFFSILLTSHGGYQLAGNSNAPASGDKSEDDYDYTPPVSFQEVQDGVAIQPTIAWDKTIGGSNDDWFRSAISTPDGGYLLVGSFLVKIDEDGNIQWEKPISAWSGIVSPEGGYLLAGSSSSGGGDYWVVKVDTQGNKVWDKTLGGSGSDGLSSAIPTADGGYLLGGPSNSPASGDKSENSKGLGDCWIVKIDADGNKVWDKTLGGSSHEQLYSAISTPDGGYLLAGFSASPASRDKSEPSKGGEDSWVVKINAQGNKIWDKTIGGSSHDGFYSAISAPDGGYLLAGFSTSDASGDKSENSKGGYDYWIVKLKEPEPPITSFTLINAQTDQEIRELKQGDVIDLAEVGNVLLSIRANTFPEKIDRVRFELSGPIAHTQVEKTPPYALFGDNKGNYVGRQLPTGKYTLKVIPYIKGKKGNAFTLYFEVVKDIVVVQPTIEWDKTLGGSDDDYLYSAISTPDGGYLMIGDSYSDASGDKSEHSKGLGDSWVVKTDVQGNKVWDKTIGGSSDDRFESVISTPDRGYLLAGYSNSDASGDKSEDSKGELDYWIVKIDAQGNKVWDKTLGGSREDYLHSAISTPDGGYLLAGSSLSNASGDKSEDSKGGNDSWVVKIDVDGNKIWDKTMGGNNGDLLFSAISTPGGGYLLGGYSGSNASGDKSENSKGSGDYWVVEIDVDGNKVWGQNHWGK